MYQKLCVRMFVNVSSPLPTYHTLTPIVLTKVGVRDKNHCIVYLLRATLSSISNLILTIALQQINYKPHSLFL